MIYAFNLIYLFIVYSSSSFPFLLFFFHFWNISFSFFILFPSIPLRLLNLFFLFSILWRDEEDGLMAIDWGDWGVCPTRVYPIYDIPIQKYFEFLFTFFLHESIIALQKENIAVV